MKKIILSLTSALFTCVATAQSCVTIQQVSTNYATNQITFDVKWGTCNNTNHLYRVWVFVDYRPVTITTKGAWGRAAIAATDKGTLVSANKGVWVTGTANTTQRVTLTLNVVGNKFDWCAFATDYPPNATMNNGVYTLKGTLPFTVDGVQLGDQNTYTGRCISSITDATGNPDGFAVTPPPTITGGASTVAAGSNVTWTGSPAGGAWSTANSSIATVSNGVVTGKTVGSTNITYAVTQGGCAGSTARAIEVKAGGGFGSGNGSGISGCSTVNLPAFTSGFISTQTWTVGGKTWSAPVTVTYCNKTSFNGGKSRASNSDCRTNSNAGYGHLFSWCMVAKFKGTICPSGWSVPTKDDFLSVHNTLGNSASIFVSSWGGQFGGVVDSSGSLNHQGTYGYYWSQSEYNLIAGYYMYMLSGGSVSNGIHVKEFGFTLRCVK